MAADVRSIARRSPIVLTVFAVVTAALAATTTAFAALEKTVRLEVDGQQLTVRTFAWTWPPPSAPTGQIGRAHV